MVAKLTAAALLAILPTLAYAAPEAPPADLHGTWSVTDLDGEYLALRFDATSTVKVASGALGDGWHEHQYHAGGVTLLLFWHFTFARDGDQLVMFHDGTEVGRLRRVAP